MLLNLAKESSVSQALNYPFAAFESVQTLEVSGVLVHHSVSPHDTDRGEPVPLSHIKVIRIMRRSDLHSARSKLRVDIVIGDYREQFTFTNLNKALRLLCRGAHLVGMISELIDNSMGEVEINVGAWVKLLELTSGVTATYIGKPNPYGFELALNSLGLPKEQVLMVGDRVGSDVIGAHRFGIRSVLLRSGEFDARDLAGEIKPDIIFDSIQEILTLI